MTATSENQVMSPTAPDVESRGAVRSQTPADRGEQGLTGTTLPARAEELRLLKSGLRDGPDPGATARHKAKGRLTAHERLDLLFDEGTFHEIGQLRRHHSSSFGMDAARPHSDGVVTGWGLVNGRTVFAYAHDFRIFGGALGEAHAQKIMKIQDLALQAGCPLVALCDGAGARIQEGVIALSGYGGIFQRHCRASGVIPQISVILGPCAGGAAYAPALTDFVFMVEGIGQMFITGPDVVAAVTGQKVSLDELGGAGIHSAVSGVASFVYPDELSCLQEVRYLLWMLPANHTERAERFDHADPADRICSGLADLVPLDGSRSYDIRGVIAEIVDVGEYMEVQPGWATNLVCAFAHLDGEVVGILGNQPSVLAGSLDIDASDKGARFIQFCDAFNIPVITLVDVPGFLPGTQQEHAGIIRHGAKLLASYCAASVPRIQLILRKAYGGAYIVLDSPSIGADLSYAWPGNEVAVMGPEAAANIIFRREIAASVDPTATRSATAEFYRSELLHPLYAAEHGLVHDVIEPRMTRAVLCRSLRALLGKCAAVPQRRHANTPV